ncbi:MAG: hypothetical protein E6K91_07880 [Thaumarchaeota archaeon]|nr:MAG: hypothetical protein E6K91_07880 [Nitrososphaerota archaeon]
MRSSILVMFLISITMISVNADNQTSNRQNDEKQLVTYTGILAIGTISIGIATIITLIRTNSTHKKRLWAMKNIGMLEA